MSSLAGRFSFHVMASLAANGAATVSSSYAPVCVSVQTLENVVAGKSLRKRGDVWGTGQMSPFHVFRTCHAGSRRSASYGTRLYRVQCRVARCDMGLQAHTSHPLFACFAGPIPRKRFWQYWIVLWEMLESPREHFWVSPTRNLLG